MEIDALAASQLGLITRAQLFALGLTRHQIATLLKSGLVGIHAGLYRCAGAPSTWEQSALAAVLAAGPRAVASHETAARLHGLTDSNPGRIEILVPHTTHVSIVGVQAHRTRCLSKMDLTCVGPIPVTTPERTIIDLSSLQLAPRLRFTLDRALSRKVCDTRALLARLDELGASGWSGVACLRELLSEHVDEPSELESRGEAWLLRLLRKAGFPEPVPQYRILDERGLIVARADLAYPEPRLDLEYDGRQGHLGETAFESDRERDARLAALGWLTLRATARTRADPRAFLAAVAERLRPFYDVPAL